MSLHQGERAVVDLHHHALERLHAGLDLEEAEHHGLVGAEQGARGDPEEEGVADLAGGAGDGDVDGWFGCHGGRLIRRAGRANPVGTGGQRPRADRPEARSRSWRTRRLRGRNRSDRCGPGTRRSPLGRGRRLLRASGCPRSSAWTLSWRSPASAPAVTALIEVGTSVVPLARAPPARPCGPGPDGPERPRRPVHPRGRTLARHRVPGLLRPASTTVPSPAPLSSWAPWSHCSAGIRPTSPASSSRPTAGSTIHAHPVPLLLGHPRPAECWTWPAGWRRAPPSARAVHEPSPLHVVPRSYGRAASNARPTTPTSRRWSPWRSPTTPRRLPDAAVGRRGGDLVTPCSPLRPSLDLEDVRQPRPTSSSPGRSTASSTVWAPTWSRCHRPPPHHRSSDVSVRADTRDTLGYLSSPAEPPRPEVRRHGRLGRAAAPVQIRLHRRQPGSSRAQLDVGARDRHGPPHGRHGGAAAPSSARFPPARSPRAW